MQLKFRIYFRSPSNTCGVFSNYIFSVEEVGLQLLEIGEEKNNLWSKRIGFPKWDVVSQEVPLFQWDTFLGMEETFILYSSEPNFSKQLVVGKELCDAILKLT